MHLRKKDQVPGTNDFFYLVRDLGVLFLSPIQLAPLRWLRMLALVE